MTDDNQAARAVARVAAAVAEREAPKPAAMTPPEALRAAKPWVGHRDKTGRFMRAGRGL